MKKTFYNLLKIFLTACIFFNATITTYAQETIIPNDICELVIVENDEYFEPIEMESRGYYYTTITTRISEVSTGKVYLRVDVTCIENVASIQSTITLQKLVSGTWTNVASKTVSASSTDYMSKTVSASGLSSGGTYRARSVTKITGYTGRSETATGYSGSITLS